jgi:hypothetical protein
MLHVCVLGVDGSGKSTVTAALPGVLAAEMNLVAGAAGDAFRVVGPDEDHLAPGFHPDGLPVAARLAMRFRRAAKRAADDRKLYPVLKLAHMLCQDGAAEVLSRRYRAGVMVSDGNAVLSTAGRAANYLRAASDGDGAQGPAPDEEDLRAAFAYVLDAGPVPAGSAPRLSRLRKGRLIYKLCRLLRLRAPWLPDVVILLDLSPEAAVARINARGKKVDRHENLADLAQAREMYLKAVRAFRRYDSRGAAHVIRVDGLSTGETISAVVEALRPHLLARGSKGGRCEATLGTTGLAEGAIQKKAFSPRYVTHYLLAECLRGAWREPTFFFSNLGRLLLREGYSAGVMKAIYDQDARGYGRLDRVFLEYPLHRAVYDRLQSLTDRIETEIESRLGGGREVRLFTAPSGFAYDVFRPLEAIARRRPDCLRRVHVVAADLDPHNVLGGELAARAEQLGVRFTFLRGDITGDEMRRAVGQAAPYDLALFVGLSSWLPKPQTVRHLRWVRRHLRAGGLLITDSFTPAAYALSGRYVGYRANYYAPEVYRALVDYCGFDGPAAEVVSGRDRINHVLFAAPRSRRGREVVSRRRAEYALAGGR